MKNLVIAPPRFITRSILQTLFHRALIAGDHVSCTGLLGAPAQAEDSVQHIAFVDTNTVLTSTLESWKSKQVHCVGSFRLEHEELSEVILKAMPDMYIELSVRLDEVGRLDVLAYLCGKNGQGATPLTLDLIEDGHAVADE